MWAWHAPQGFLPMELPAGSDASERFLPSRSSMTSAKPQQLHLSSEYSRAAKRISTYLPAALSAVIAPEPPLASGPLREACTACAMQVSEDGSIHVAVAQASGMAVWRCPPGFGLSASAVLSAIPIRAVQHLHVLAPARVGKRRLRLAFVTSDQPTIMSLFDLGSDR